MQAAVTAGWLTVASLCFYGWSNPRCVALLGGSIVFNYALAMSSLRSCATGSPRTSYREEPASPAGVSCSRR